MIGDKMKEYETVRVKVKDIKIDNCNPNVMSKDVEDRLSFSMERWGNTQPIVVDKKTMFLADGEHRLKQYISRGLNEVPVILINFKNDADRRAYRQSSNKTRGTHDEVLDLPEYSIIMQEDKDLLKYCAGVDYTEVEQHLRNLENENKEEVFDVDTALSEVKVPVSKVGDVYCLGEHRLMCGDSTKSEDVAILMQEDKPILMVTDPPYGVNYNPSWRNKTNLSNGIKRPTRAEGKVDNDDIIDWSTTYSLFNGNIAYVWHAGKYTKQVQESLEKCDFEVINQIIWVKPHFILSRGDYHWKHEPCLYVVKKGKNHNWQGDRKQTTTWEIAGMNCFGGSKDAADEHTGHGTQKPVECMLKPIINNTEVNDYVYDPFVGGGDIYHCSRKNWKEVSCYGN